MVGRLGHEKGSFDLVKKRCVALSPREEYLPDMIGGCLNADGRGSDNRGRMAESHLQTTLQGAQKGVIGA